MRASIHSDNWNNNCQAKKKNEKIECYLKKVIVMLLQQYFKLLQSFRCFASIELASKGAKNFINARTSRLII